MPKFSAKYIPTGESAPDGWVKYGNIAVDVNGTANASTQPFTPGIDTTLEANGYVIITDTTNAGIVGRPKAGGGTAGESVPTFWLSNARTEASFCDLFNRLPARKDMITITAGTAASEWLNNNGYWTSFTPPVPYLLLEDIATYLRGHMSDFRNPSFYYYQLDGDGNFISDGGGDMYDSGNYTTPWLLSGANYTSSGGSFPFSINYTNTTSTTVDTDFYYLSLGYVQFSSGSQSGTYHPLTVLGSRQNPGVVGWQAGGNSGADGGGTLASGEVWSGTVSNGFTTYAYYRQTYNAGDPSHCNLIILLGHPTWNSSFGTINSFADPTGNGGNGIYYYSTTASNILAIHTLLSKNSGQLVTVSEIKNVVSNFTLRIKESLNY